jgi:hypothetical protein
VATISNTSDRVLHPVYFTEIGGERKPNFVHLKDMKAPGVPPAVEDRAGLVGRDGLPLRGPAIAHEIDDAIAQNILDNGKNASLLKSGLVVSVSKKAKKE